MNGPDGKNKWFIDRNFVICTIIFVLVIGSLFVIAGRSRPKAYQNCAQLKLDGHSYIRSDSPLYQKRLDPNKNGIACE